MKNNPLPIKRVFRAYLDELQLIVILVPHENHRGNPTFFLRSEQNLEKLTIQRTIPLEGFIKYECSVSEEVVLGKLFTIVDEIERVTDLQIGAVIRTNRFDELYFYDGRLGYIYNEESTTFRVWTPTATNVQLKLFSTYEILYAMERMERGVFEITIVGNLENMKYTYVACINRVWREAVDPYATSVTVNGHWGAIVNLNKTKQDKPSLPVFSEPTDAIIYELHVRDFSIHPNSGIQAKGKYLGLTEKGTTTKNGSVTGLDYLRELGITHVEILPINKYGEVDEERPLEKYNWGYNPLHFNTPEGIYATNPHNPYTRIDEAMLMIRTLQSEGIRVIIDVVYNHVHVHATSSFERLVPGYYFRYDNYGMPSDGTGVGNDIASERKMVRKFILDSIQFWLTHYKVDGFRFDLMGILDVYTMNTIRKLTDSMDKNVLLLGEGWNLNTPLDVEKKAATCNAEKMPTISFFNDQFRDRIKGSTFHVSEKGFALGNGQNIKQVIAGSAHIFVAPRQSVNYVECHDNYTFWDKQMACNVDEDIEVWKKRERLATAIVLLSQGIPFLHSGQEFYRTKYGIENTYNSPDSINQLDWNRKELHISDVKYVKGLIALRKYHRAFRLTSFSDIRNHLQFLESSGHIIAYKLGDVSKFGEWEDIIVIHSNQATNSTLNLPDGKWHVVVQGEQSGVAAIKIVTKLINIHDIGTTVLYK